MLGRWINRDPIEEEGFILIFEGGMDLSENPNLEYLFCNSNPINLYDDKGLIAPVIIGGVIVGWKAWGWGMLAYNSLMAIYYGKLYNECEKKADELEAEARRTLDMCKFKEWKKKVNPHQECNKLLSEAGKYALKTGGTLIFYKGLPAVLIKSRELRTL